jgi:hypothetical protein
MDMRSFKSRNELTRQDRTIPFAELERTGDKAIIISVKVGLLPFQLPLGLE